MAGFWPNGSGPGPSWVYSQSTRQRALQSWDALRQRIALGVGPTPARWSTNPGDGLTPDQIIRCRREAVAGFPWRWADLCEQVIERNSHIRSLMHFRRAWALSDVISWRIDPPKQYESDEVAQFVAAWQTAVLNQSSIRNLWADQTYQLLSASAYGYAAAEIFWEWRTIEFMHKGQNVSVRSWVPVGLEQVHQKAFRFDLDSDQPGFYSNDASMLRWPRGKILFHRTLGDGITERRGWMTAGVWIELGLQQGWQDLLIYMHLYGIPQVAVFVDKAVLDPGEERDILDNALDDYGQGRVPVMLDEWKLEPIGSVQGTGDPIHPRVIEIAKSDLSMLVTGSVLAQSQGNGTGSYGATSEHAITAHVYRIPDGTQLANSISMGLLEPALLFNLDALRVAGNFASWQLQNRSGVFGWKANGPAPTTKDVIAEAEALDRMGFPLSAREISQRTGWSIGQGEDRLILSRPDIVQPQRGRMMGRAPLLLP